MVFTNIENLIKSKSIESTRIEYKKGLNPHKVAVQKLRELSKNNVVSGLFSFHDIY